MTRKLLITAVLITLCSGYSLAGPLVIGTNIYIPAPPYTWINTCQKKAGGGVYTRLGRALENISQPYHYKLPDDFPDTTYQSTRQQIISGAIDAGFFTYKQEDKALIFVEQPVFKLQNIIVSKKTAPVTADSFDDLKNLRGSFHGNKETNNLAAAATDADIPLTLAKDNLDSLNRLKRGEVDYIVSDRYYFQALIDDVGGDESLFQSPINFIRRAVYLGMENNNKNKQLAKELATQFETISQSTYSNFVYGKMLKIWISTDQDCIYQTYSEPSFN